MNKQRLIPTIIAATLALSISGCVLEGDDGQQGPAGPQGVQGPVGISGNDGAVGQSGAVNLSLEVVGRFASGVYGKSAAEIVQFHPASQSVFAVNGVPIKLR